MDNDILGRYEQAQALMQGTLSSRLVMNDAVFPHWIGCSHCFWYIRETSNGKQFRLVDAEANSNKLAFDHKALAKALTKSAGQDIDHQDLPIQQVTIKLSPLQIYFQALDKLWLFNPNNGLCQEQNIADKQNHLLSPDGKKAAFIREHNIWVRDQVTGEEQALTDNGTKDYCYARGYMGLDNTVQASWSPDSKRLFTVQLDTREVALRPYIHYAPKDETQHPQLSQVKFAYPGDEHVETYRLVVIEVNSARQQQVDYSPLPVMVYGEQAFGFFNGKPLGWWSTDNRHAYFIDVTRGSKAVRVVELDTHTGTTRVLFEETADTFVKLGHSFMDIPVFLPLPESNELIWFSERSGWGHLYLYDLNTGDIKHSITEGQWLVREVLHLDAAKREILIQTAARNPNINPYYRDICKVNIDTSLLTPLVSGCFEYNVYDSNSVAVLQRHAANLDAPNVDGVSSSGQYIVTTRSRVDTTPVSVMIDRNGREILTLETADVSGLPPNWIWPEPVALKGADERTDIYGVVFRPPGFSPENKYPVLDFSHGSRSYASVPQGSFINGPCVDYTYLVGASLAALGFVVVAMEGRGTPYRDKAFQDHHYGDPSAASEFSDRIAGLRQLAKRLPYMDLERVGITGIDTPTNFVYGLLDHPDFYKVAVIHCLMEPQFTFASYGETYEGISIDKDIIPKQRNIIDCVKKLKGKLLLVDGMLSLATPSSTFQLVDALQKANKDFDMICLPNGHHDVPNYALRRNWDYLVKYLQNIEPPKEFQLTTVTDALPDTAPALT